MKLGIFLLILGVLMAGAGVAAWVYADPDTALFGLQRLNIDEAQILFDPLVLPIAVDSSQGLTTLKTIEQIKFRHPSAKVIMGLSNISYGLPNRKLVNRAFLVMAIYAGLDAVILDPLDTKIMSLMKASDVLTNRDPFCKEFIRSHRKGILSD